MPSQALPSAIQLYLRQINRTPLLTAEEERRLAQLVMTTGCMESRERMISANLRLVVAIAKRYVNRGLPLGDLIEEGNIGLVKAVENYDPGYGARFSTYAAWWIKQSIKRALINAGQPIHVPAYMVELVSRWKRAKRDLELSLGRSPSVAELAEAMALPARKVRAIHDAVRAFQAPSRGAVGEDGEIVGLDEILEDEKSGTPDEPLILRDQLELLADLLGCIDEREALILRLRFGLDGEEPLTLKEIGQRIGLTRERVRQLEIEATGKLFARMDPDGSLLSNSHASRRVRAGR